MDEIQIIKRLRRMKVVTIGQLVSLLESSVITARRYLKRWRAHTSVNHNGRYYTLPDIPKFDSNGIWKYQTILFSQYGNLKQTMIQLIRRSEAGLSAREVGQMVALASNSSIFSQLLNISGIRREKHQGHFVYFSDESATYERQKSALYRQGISGGFPSDEEAVLILVQYIKHPQIDLEKLSQRVAKEGKNIAPAVIRRFLEHHGLLKKTADIGP